MLELLFPEVVHDFWHKFDHRLWVSDFKDVVKIKLLFVFLEPNLSSGLHLSLDLVSLQLSLEWLDGLPQLFFH